MVQIGGNKRFFEFLREYGKEREPITKKYTTAAAVYYRKMLCFEAKNIEFTEPQPAKNAKELADRTMKSTSNWAKGVDEKYAVQEKASEMAQKTKAGAASLWGKMTGKTAENAENAGG